ncbi:hypothetical protein FF1_008685 [Malus domestica]
MVVGDLIELLWQHEKLGGSQWNPIRARFLRDFIDNNYLLDIGFCGPLFTWTISDVPKSRKLFKLEAFWADDPDCREIVETGWNEGLGRSERRLIAWSKEKFSKDHELAGQLLGELEQIQSSFILNNARELEISAQLSTIWAREEKFWQQRSRISWLHNTRFFHLTTMQRRCKNKITRVANEDGVWAEENGDIRDTFETFFMDLYKSDGKRLGESFNWVASVHYPGDECFVMLSFYQ